MELSKDYWSRWTATLRYGGHAFNLKLYDLDYYLSFYFLLFFCLHVVFFLLPPFPLLVFPPFSSSFSFFSFNSFHLLFYMYCMLFTSLFYTLFFCPSLSPSSLQEWLRYQSLWDMEFSNITAKVGDDLVLWQRLLQDIK